MDFLTGDSADIPFGMEELGIDRGGNPIEPKETAAEALGLEPNTEPDEPEDGPELVPQQAAPEPVEEEDVDIFDAFLKEQNSSTEEPEEDFGGDVPPALKGQLKEFARAREAAEAQAAQQAQQYQDQQQQMAQMYQQFQQQLHETQLENARYKALYEHGMYQEPAEDPDDPVVQLKRQILEEAKGAYQSELEPLQQQLQAYQKAQKDAEERVLIDQRKAEYSNEAESAVRDVLFEGWGEVDPELIQEAKESVLAKAYGHNISFRDAAFMVRNSRMKYASGFTKNRSKSGAKQVAKSRKAPTTLPNARGSGAVPQPNASQLEKAGYETFLDWMMDGSPSIS
jgi:hypothetical protein